ncbi:hypothetical protein C0J45_22212 [Silurus meridionalis]|nr:hypothetical protein C0J45_22212 [Silurus meridionalis]
MSNSNEQERDSLGLSGQIQYVTQDTLQMISLGDFRMSDSNTSPSFTLTKPSVDDSSDSSDEPWNIRFEIFPDLPLNKTLDRLLKQMDFSYALPAHSYAGPGDVACDICIGEKIRATKSFLTCGVSSCETHVRHHYTVEAFSHHVLGKRFERYPDLQLNKTLDRLLKQMDFSYALPAHSYAGPGDVACDICTGEKIRASKSFLTCGVSSCETHVMYHYTVEAFSHHVLVDARKDLKQNICQQDDGGCKWRHLLEEKGHHYTYIHSFKKRI